MIRHEGMHPLELWDAVSPFCVFNLMRNTEEFFPCINSDMPLLN